MDNKTNQQTKPQDKPVPTHISSFKSPAPYKGKEVSFDTDKLDEMVQIYLPKKKKAI